MQPSHLLTQLNEYVPSYVGGYVSVDIMLQHDRIFVVKNHNGLIGWHDDSRGANTLVDQIDQ
jgi:hypothetical protein